MKKNRVFSLAVVLMVIAMIVTGSFAFFTDKDSADNVFVAGDVKIQLDEDFEQNSVLLPCTGSAQAGTLKNGVKKEIRVDNIGASDAFVRVHIAIPQILDNGDPSFDASRNVLHFNFSNDAVAEGKWDWSKAIDDGVMTGNWNYYEQEIDGIKYNVYVVTYQTAVAPGARTEEPAMHQVYLDKKVTSHDMEAIKDVLGEEWEIKVIAEACQADGFDDAFQALNTAFGNPGAYDAFAQ